MVGVVLDLLHARIVSFTNLRFFKTRYSRYPDVVGLVVLLLGKNIYPSSVRKSAEPTKVASTPYSLKPIKKPALIAGIFIGGDGGSRTHVHCG